LLAKTLDRLTLLRNLVDKLLAWLPRTGTEEFLRTWESRLAWRGERVQVLQMVDNQDHASTVQGSLTGLDEAGHLCLLSDSGEMHVVEAGDLSLRLLD
jgi:biotin-(acetyl-CoA carboxylase) ligase